MKEAPPHPEERRRLLALHDLDILDTLEEQAYDDLTALAAHITNVPVALVSLLDKDRQWFKSRHGIDATETPRSLAFCAHAILQRGAFVVEDAHEDERFADNPLVTGAPHVRFYAGVPLRLDDDLPLGTLCIIDHEPRTMSAERLEQLEALGRQVQSQLSLRRKVRQLEALDRLKDEFLALASHELRTPVTSIYGGLSLLRSGAVERGGSRSERCSTSPPATPSG